MWTPFRKSWHLEVSPVSHHIFFEMITLANVLLSSWAFLCMVAVTLTLSYSELEHLGVSCPPRDSCRNRTTNDTEIKYTCECERSCAERGTCCIDSQYMDSDSSPARQQCIQSAEDFGCGIVSHIWTVTRCIPGWNKSSTVEKLCEGDAQSLNNFLMLVPAESSITSDVYRNYYCAVCNDDQKDVFLWKVKLKVARPYDFDEQKAIFPQDIKYDENLGWGYWHSFNPGESGFRSGFVIINPRSSQKKKECRSDIIRNCVSSWKDVEVQKKCESYMAVLRGPMELIGGKYVRRVFKNIHCAVCNNVVNFEDVTCEQYYENKKVIGCGHSHSGGGNILPIQLGRNIGTQYCPEEGETFDKDYEVCIREVL